jgi:ribonuclease VapC
MIAVDTSALMAIVLNEPEADACMAALASEDDLLISAGTVAEALIVSTRRNVGEARLIDELGFEIVTATLASARRSAQAYGQWGKGVHPAALNLGDCFA